MGPKMIMMFHLESEKNLEKERTIPSHRSMIHLVFMNYGAEAFSHFDTAYFSRGEEEE